MADVKSDFNPKEKVDGDPIELPHLACGAMANSKPIQGVVRPDGGARISRPAGGRLARQGDQPPRRTGRQFPRAARLSQFLRQMRRLHRQMPLFPRHRRPEEHAGRAPGPAAQGLSPPFHLRGEIFSVTGRGRGPDQGTPRRLVQLFPSMFGMPALFCFLPLWHRYGRNHHGRSRHHGHDRHRQQIHQRDHRQGLHRRQQSRPAGQGPARDA